MKCNEINNIKENQPEKIKDKGLVSTLNSLMEFIVENNVVLILSNHVDRGIF